MRTLGRVCAALFVVSMLSSICAAAGPSTSKESIYGFYLGESKQALLQRAAKEGISYKPCEKVSGVVFSDNYMFDASMDKSKQVKSALVSFQKGSVGQLCIYLNQSTNGTFLQAAQVLDQSWNGYPGYSGQTFGPTYIITLPDVLITLVEAKDQMYISYIDRKALRASHD
jgi:hypothetical protein